MESHQQRVLEEQGELQTKCDRLATFMMGEVYQGLPEKERGLLSTQLILMRQYNDVLVERMKAWV